MANERRTRARANPVRLIIGVTLVGAAVCFLPGAAPPVRAADRAADDEGKASAAPTRAEFAKLQVEVREQRQLIIQILQNEQQRYDMLLKLLQSQQGSGGTLAPAATAALVDPEAAPAESASAKEARPSR